MTAETTPPAPAYPRVELNEAQRLWLANVYEKHRAKEPVDHARIRRELAKRIPADFDPATIDPRIIRRGKEITLLGILHADPGSQFPVACDIVIRTVQEWMERDPPKTRFSAEEVSQATGGKVTSEGVSKVWAMLESVGTYSDGHDDAFAYITVGQDSTARAYAGYRGMASALQEAFEIQAPFQWPKGPQAPPGRPAQGPQLDPAQLESMWPMVHADVQGVARRLFDQGNYRQAVFDAFLLIDNRVRDAHKAMRGIELAGKKVMEAALSSDPAKASITLDDLTTTTGRDTQVGYQLMLVGAMLGIRNPKAHEFVTVTPARAMQFLLFAGLLMDRLDEAEAPAAKNSRDGLSDGSPVF